MYRMALMALIAGDIPGVDRERLEFHIIWLYKLTQYAIGLAQQNAIYFDLEMWFFYVLISLRRLRIVV